MKEFLNGLPGTRSNVHACLAHTLNINIINIVPRFIEGTPSHLQCYHSTQYVGPVHRFPSKSWPLHVCIYIFNIFIYDVILRVYVVILK